MATKNIPLIPLFAMLKGYKPAYLAKDTLAGLVVAALSIPIALGYAQVAGLPAIYGLYGSIPPLIVFAFMSASPSLVVGMDAAGSAIMGSVLLSAGIAAQSDDARIMVPLVSLCCGLWLILFAKMRLGRLAAFVSKPVMGGFISGIAVSIMSVQVVKIFGLHQEHGEFVQSMMTIFEGVAAGDTVWAGVIMGVITIALLEVMKRVAPKVPMVLIVLIAAIVFASVVDVSQWGVTALGALPVGFDLQLPILPSKSQLTEALTLSLTVAAVVAVESILADNNFASKGGYRINENREMAGFGVSNILCALVGASPASASVSRTAAANQYGAKSQIANLVAALCIILVCLFATPYLSVLPTPILAGIVVSALLSVVEFDLAARLAKVSHSDFFIFLAVFVAVLVVGIMFGVALGITLSFLQMVRRSIDPPRSFVGFCQRTGMLTATGLDHPDVARITNVVLYRFAGALHFANSRIAKDDIEGAITDETEAVFFDVSMVPQMDLSAADDMVDMVTSFEKRGIPFYLIGINKEMGRQVASYEPDWDHLPHPRMAQDMFEALALGGYHLRLEDGHEVCLVHGGQENLWDGRAELIDEVESHHELPSVVHPEDTAALVAAKLSAESTPAAPTSPEADIQTSVSIPNDAS